ncbi:hypothetical protein LEMLEM_LOCUS9654 [Lemmus lemmus]
MMSDFWAATRKEPGWRSSAATVCLETRRPLYQMGSFWLQNIRITDSRRWEPVDCFWTNMI